MFNVRKIHTKLSEIFNLPNLTIMGIVLMVGSIWGNQIVFEFDKFTAYTGVPRFGDDCEYAVDIWGRQDTYAKILRMDHQYIKHKMPYLASLEFPTVPESGYLIVRCGVDLSGLNKDGYAWLHLGMVFGESAIYLNGALKTLLDSHRFVEIPLTPSERVKDSRLVIISKRTPTVASPGPCSFFPFSYGDGQEKAEKISNIIQRILIELPMTRLNFLIGFLMLFVVIWLFGVRYPDIGWIIVVAGVLCLNMYIGLAFIQQKSRFLLNFINAVNLSFPVALASFLLHFFRIKINRKIPVIVFLATLIASGFLVAISNAYGQINSFYVFAAEAVCCALISVAAAAYGLIVSRKYSKGRKIRICVISACSIFAAISYLYVSFTYYSQGVRISFNLLNLIIVTIFAIFMIIDLVIYRRNFFSEKEQRLFAEEEKLRLQEKIFLAGTVQQMLLPKTQQESYLSFDFSYGFSPHEGMAGDWVDFWKKENEMIIMIGDVTGQGPAAALAMTTIATIIFEAKTFNLEVEDCIERINSGLIGLYNSHFLSTLSVLRAGKDGLVKYTNFGSLGWIKINKQGNLVLTSGYSSLGVSRKIKIRWEEYSASLGDLIFAVTDGYLEGSHQLSLFFNKLSNIKDSSMEFLKVLSCLEEISEEFNISDDRTYCSVVYRGGSN